MPVIDLARLLGPDFRQRLASVPRLHHPGEPKDILQRQESVVKKHDLSKHNTEYSKHEAHRSASLLLSEAETTKLVLPPLQGL